MSKPETSIFPIEHGKLTTDLDANNLQILNLDTSNLPGGSGNDTGTTTAILKGDGDHGFADAVADVDYASVGSVGGLETSADHDADLAVVTADITTLETDLAALTTVVGNKADASNVSDALALKENITDHDADITAVEGDIATVASDLATLTTAVGNKADSASVSAALAGKEPLLPTTVNDSYVLARHNAGGTDQWFFVDPVTLGSTNATYGDGQTHSNTTFNSTLAVFTTNDTGKTIVCAGNIPTDTTITFVNATTVTLSNAATTTASGLTFVILNRFLPSGSSGGTVTSVALNNNATALLSIPAVANSTTTPTITINSTTPAAHTFYGNNSGVAGVPIFMDATQARNNLGGTVIGQAIFQASSISAFSYVRVNNDNTVTMLNRSQTVTDLGVENALTFNAPLQRSTNTIFIPSATSTQDGYLKSTDWATFNAKVSAATTLITTAPLTIDGLGFATLSQNRTLAMPASTGNADGTSQVNGYLTGADHTLFANKPPNSRTIATTSPMMINPTAGGAVAVGATGDLSANRTIAIQRASTTTDGYLAASDFLGFNAGSNNAVQVSSGPITINSTASPRINKIFVTAALSARLDITLPLAGNYDSSLNFPSIEIIDISSGGHSANGFGIRLIRQSTNLINGSASSLDLPLNIGYVRLNSDGLSRWTTTRYYVQSLTNPTNIAGTATFNTSGLTAARTITVPDANSSLTVAFPKVVGEWINSYDSATGLFDSEPIRISDLQSVQDDITAGAIIAKAHTVPNRLPTSSLGQIDNVRLSASLDITTAPLTVTWPSAANYGAGEVIRFYDASGSITSTNNVIVTNGTDNFNGSTSIVISEQYANRTFVSDNGTNWSVSQFSGANNGTTIGFAGALSENTSAHTITWPCSTGAPTQTAYATITGNDTLVISGQQPGMRFELMVTQGPGGSKVLTLPTQSSVEGNGLGLITLSSTAGAVDKLTGTYYGATGLQWAWDAPQLNYTPAVPLSNSTPVDTNGTGASSGTFVGSGNTSLYVAIKWTPSNASLGRVDLGLYYIGTPNAATLQVELHSDATPTTPLNPVGAFIASTNTVNVSDINAILQSTNTLAGAVTNPTRFDFTSTQTLNTSLSYWIVLHCSSFNATNHPNWATQTVAPHYFKSPDAITWTDSGSNTKLYFKSYRP